MNIEEKEKFNKQFGEHFAKILIKERTSKNISKLEMAKTLKISLSTLNNWEKGLARTSLRHVYRVYKYLNVPLKELFDFKLQ